MDFLMEATKVVWTLFKQKEILEGKDVKLFVQDGGTGH
jgi:hypothetical protein